jgi:hypothetical protein
MKNYKRVDGDYIIELVNQTDVLTLNSQTVEVTGNLEVSGNVTYINTEQLTVNDPFLLLNKNESGSYNATSGLVAHKTATTYAGLRFNTVSNAWEITSNTDEDGSSGTWSAIAGGASGTVAGANTQVQFNDSGSFGAEANFTYDSATNQIGLDGSIALTDQGGAPSSVASATVLYGDTVGGGGTGVYFVDDTTSDELVSKSKAIVYGIIF